MHLVFGNLLSKSTIVGIRVIYGSIKLRFGINFSLDLILSNGKISHLLLTNR